MRRLDIHDTLDTLCERHLGRKLRLELDCAWSYFPSTGRYKGTFAVVELDDDSADIRIDRHLLEWPWVPTYFLKDLVWHEGVHVWRYEESEDIDANHSSVFELAACLYPQRLKAESWYRRNEERLLRYLDKVRTKHDILRAC